MGRTIADRYRVLRVVAEGGMGIVYEAEQNMGEGTRKVAIKTLLPELSQDHVVVSRFTRECAVVASLEHPNTVRVYDFGRTDDGILYIAMEFVRGRPLGDVMAEGCMSLQRCLPIVEQVSLALEEAHQLGIVHRDLKPDNVVLAERAGIHDFVKLLDFGIAMRSSHGGKLDTKLTQQGMVLGTPPYMSPEQFTSEALDRTSDIYSLAVIVYEMLNGRLPFEADTPWQWAHHHMSSEPMAFTAVVPKAVEQVVLSALSKQRKARPATTLEFYRRLAEAAGIQSERLRHLVGPAPVQTPRPVAVRAGSAFRTEPSRVREPSQDHTADGASGLLGLLGRTEPSAVPTSAVGAFTTEPGELAASGGERIATTPDVSALGLGTHSSTGTVPGARAMAHSAVLVTSPLPTRLVSPRRRGNVIVAWVFGGLLVLGAAVAGVTYWLYWQESNLTPPPVTPSTEPAVAVVAAEPQAQVGRPSVGYTMDSPSTPTKARSATVNGSSPTWSQTTSVGGVGGTTALGTSVTTPASTVGTGATTPPSPLPFPIPFAIPTGFSLPSPFPQATPTPAPTSTSVGPAATTSPAGNVTATGLANCAQATALAGTNMDAAVDQYLICQTNAGTEAARATRGTLARVGKSRAQSLARQGRCAEANAIVSSLTKIGAQSLAQAAVKSTSCASQ